MVFDRRSFSSIWVLATGVATIMLLFLLLYAYATSRVGFDEAIATALLVFFPIGAIGVFGVFRRFSPQLQLFR